MHLLASVLIQLGTTEMAHDVKFDIVQERNFGLEMDDTKRAGHFRLIAHTMQFTAICTHTYEKWQ